MGSLTARHIAEKTYSDELEDTDDRAEWPSILDIYDAATAATAFDGPSASAIVAALASCVFFQLIYLFCLMHHVLFPASL